MDLRPYICKQCGGTIDLSRMECEYCGTKYESESLRNVRVIKVTPDTRTICTEVRLSREMITQAPEAARDYTLREMRNQIADALLGFMQIRTAHEYSFLEDVEIIRGEIRVCDPV